MNFQETMHETLDSEDYEVIEEILSRLPWGFIGSDYEEYCRVNIRTIEDLEQLTRGDTFYRIIAHQITGQWLEHVDTVQYYLIPSYLDTRKEVLEHIGKALSEDYWPDHAIDADYKRFLDYEKIGKDFLKQGWYEVSLGDESFVAKVD